MENFDEQQIERGVLKLEIQTDSDNLQIVKSEQSVTIKGTVELNNYETKTNNESSPSKAEHEPDKKVCNTCGKTFKRIGTLNVHLRIHKGDKTHECEICGKQFTHKCTLDLHKLIHSTDIDHLNVVFAQRVSKQNPI